jgi:AmmeMemoRadiSam system protein A
MTPAEGGTLLAIARAAVASELGLPAASVGALTPALAEPLGVFVTLATRTPHGLRGCVGFVEARRPLAEGVAEAARAAAFRDSRFAPVTAAEYPGLGFEVSVLSRPEPIAPTDVTVGVHGLILRHAGRSGLLLPQVPGEYGWNREQFLEALCRKAGLAPGAWKAPDAELLGFTAQVFEEES